jgi:hypothetical protein
VFVHQFPKGSTMLPRRLGGFGNIAAMGDQETTDIGAFEASNELRFGLLERV